MLQRKEVQCVNVHVYYLFVYLKKNRYFPDCPTSSVCVYRLGVQPDRSSIWKVPESGLGSRHVWRAVYLHQVRYYGNHPYFHQLTEICALFAPIPSLIAIQFDSLYS